MRRFASVFRLLNYSLEEVEKELASGTPAIFEDAIPTEYDAFLVMCQDLGVLDALEELTDVREDPSVPRRVLCVLMLCRFLHCLKTFGRMGEVLLRYHPLLQRLGVDPMACERGGYYQCKRTERERDTEDAPKPFDEEVLSEFLRGVKFDEFLVVLKVLIQALRRRHPELFRRGLFIIDSNHYRLKGSHKEYKWCALMLWTPKGMIPVWFEFTEVGGEGTGETSIGRRVMEGALEAYGSGFFKMVLMDTGYLDGETLAWMKKEHGIDWMVDTKEDMKVSEWMVAEGKVSPNSRWRQVEGPKLEIPKVQLPKRHVLWFEDLHNFYTYGARVNGCLIRDTYPKSDKYPEGAVIYQCVVTSRRDWNAVQIHKIWRLRWCIEDAFGAMTNNWGMGKWQIIHPDVYQATVQFAALTYGLLVSFLYEREHGPSLQKMADRFERQARNMFMIRAGNACAIVTPAVLDNWMMRGILQLRSP